MSSLSGFQRARLLACEAIIHQRRRMWTSVPLAPPDPILGLSEAYEKDKESKKINLGIGAYRDETGNPYVFRCVRKAEELILRKFADKEYLPIIGNPNYRSLAAELAYGSDSKYISQGRLATAQSISGTGALCLSAFFLRKFYKQNKVVYTSSPSWSNHRPLLEAAGFEVMTYRYYDSTKKSLDFEGMVDDLKAMPDGSIVLIHACAHNPTGVDPTKEQFETIAEVLKTKGHLPLVDMAYQGFATGDVTGDSFIVRKLQDDDTPFMLCQSFSKNLGLYGERVGLVSIVTQSPEETKKVESQLKIIARSLYSSPPINGSRIVEMVLGTDTLKNEWLNEVKDVSWRIINMRRALRHILENELKSPHSWEHITSQIGMFCYTGLGVEQTDALVNKYFIYLTKDGRISMAGVNEVNINYLAESLHEVTKNLRNF